MGMGSTRADHSTFIENANLPDVWFDGIHRIETMHSVCRMLLFRNRLTSDLVPYRQHVGTVLCPKAVVPQELRHVSLRVLGLDTIAGWKN
jgi:hypothetical protein